MCVIPVPTPHKERKHCTVPEKGKGTMKERKGGEKKELRYIMYMHEFLARNVSTVYCKHVLLI